MNARTPYLEGYVRGCVLAPNLVRVTRGDCAVWDKPYAFTVKEDRARARLRTHCSTMVHLPNMSSLTIHGPLLPIGSKKRPKRPSLGRKARPTNLLDAPAVSEEEDASAESEWEWESDDDDTPAESESEGDRPPRRRYKKKAKNLPTRNVLLRRRRVAPSSSEEDNSDPKRSTSPPKDKPRPSTGRGKEKAGTHPLGVTEKKQKTLPKAYQVVDDAFAKAVTDRLRALELLQNWGIKQLSDLDPQPAHVPCCNGQG